MKLASSFLVSVTLHALAMAYPVFFFEPKQLDLVRVTILPDENESTTESPEVQSSGKSARSFGPKLSTQRLLAQRREVPASSKLKTEHPPQAPPIATPADELQYFVTALDLLRPSLPAGQTENSTGHFHAEDGTDAGKGNNFGQSRVDGSGSAALGGGLGQGTDDGGRARNLTRARYRETPKPNYPESARRNGREGTVLLRVLVDDEGRAKSVEINKSSGDDALDRAAREAVKQWRFIPAHYGEKTVESWIRIPVDFRLADRNTR